MVLPSTASFPQRKHGDGHQSHRSIKRRSTSCDWLILGRLLYKLLAEKYGCKGVALNPAVRAARELAPHVGMMTAYDSDEPFDFRPE